MKKLCCLLLIVSLGICGYSQISPYSKPAEAPIFNTYVSPDFNSIIDAALARQARYDQNKKYLNAIKVWILDLKSQVNEPKLLNDLNNLYSNLINLEDADLSVKSNELNNIKLAVLEAVDSYNTRLENENNPNVLYKKGFELYDAGEFSSARILFTKVIKANPSFENGYFMRAYCHYALHDYTSAILDLDEVLLLNNNNSGARSLRGWCNIYLGYYKKSLLDFNEYIKTNPLKEEGYLGRGYSKSNLGDYYGGNRDYKKVVEINPNHSMAYNNIGWNCFEQGDFEQALKYVSIALIKDSSNSTAWDSKAEIYFTRKEYSKSKQACQKAIELNPELANSYFILGRIFLHEGNKIKACENWSKAGELGKFEVYEMIKDNCNKY